MLRSLRAFAFLATLAATALAAQPARADLLIDLSTGKGLANNAVDPQWTVTSSYFNDAWVGTKVLDDPGAFPFNGPLDPEHRRLQMDHSQRPGFHSEQRAPRQRQRPDVYLSHDL